MLTRIRRLRRGGAKPGPPAFRPDHPRSPWLAGYWTFQADGARDYGPYALHATPTSLAYEPGPTGPLGVFDGSASRASTPVSPALDFGDLTWIARIRCASGSAGTQRIIHRESDPGNQPGDAGLILVGGQPFWFGPSGFTLAGGADLRDDAWHTVAVTRLGTLVTLYVDGVAVNSGTGAATTITANRGFDFGYQQYTGPTQFFQGRIDRIAAYRRAFSAADLREWDADPYAEIRPRRRLLIDLGAAGATPSASDSATGSESASLAVAHARTDSATGTDSASLAPALVGTDSAGGTDAASLASILAGTDSGGGTDTASLAAAIGATDSAAGSESSSLATGDVRSASDSAAGTDSAALSVALVAADAATGSETSSLTAALSASDSATAAESASFGGALPVPMRRRPRASAKPAAPRVNRAHPLAAHLSYALAFSEGAGAPRDLLVGDEATPTGSPAWAQDAPGLAIDYPGALGPHYHTLPARIGSPEYCVAILCYPRSMTADVEGHHQLFSASGYTPYVTLGDGTVHAYNPSSGYISGTGGVTSDAWNLVAVQHRGGTLDLYANGSRVGGGAADGSGFGSITSARLGHRLDSEAAGSDDFDGRVALLLVFRRALSAADHAGLAADLSSLIRPSRRVPVVFGASPPGDFSASDSAAGDETAVLAVGLTASDAATGSDTAALVVTLSASDDATATDTASVGAEDSPSATDSATGSESAALAVTLATSDAGIAADAAALAVALAVADSATTTDSSSLSTGNAPSGSDAATATETASLVVSLPASDDATAAQSAQLATDDGTFVTASDSAVASESSALSVVLARPDSATAADIATLLAAGGLAGTAFRISGTVRPVVRIVGTARRVTRIDGTVRRG